MVFKVAGLTSRNPRAYLERESVDQVGWHTRRRILPGRGLALFCMKGRRLAEFGLRGGRVSVSQNQVVILHLQHEMQRSSYQIWGREEKMPNDAYGIS
jgi:hypothetical protein